MKVKNVNPIEKHIEKVVLAVAAVVAGYITFTAFTQPVLVDSKQRLGTVGASDLESQLGKEVDKLEAKWKDNDKGVATDVPNYVNQYVMLSKTPLPAGATGRTDIPWVPRNVSPDSGANQRREDFAQAIATPRIPAPLNVTAKPGRGLITNVDGNAEDLNWVLVQADYPMLKLSLAMAGDGLTENKRLPTDQQRITFYRVDVERREQAGDGSWSDWEPVLPARSQPLPHPTFAGGGGVFKAGAANTVLEDLQTLDANMQAILQPAFYKIAETAAAVTPAAAPGVQPKTADQQAADAANMQRLRMLQEENQARTSRNGADRPDMSRYGGGGAAPGGMGGPGMGGPGMGGPGMGGPGMGGPGMGGPGSNNSTINRVPVRPVAPVTPPRIMDHPDMSQFGAAGMGGPGMGGPGMGGPGMGGPGMGAAAPSAPTMSPDKQALLAQESSPIWFYDEHVTPGHTYEYRMRIRIFNPLYHLGLKLANPAMFQQPWLASEWMDLKQPVLVPANRHFFLVRNIDPASKKASIKLYQWEQGHWLTADEDILPGVTIGRQHSFPNIAKPVDFSTGYAVVNIENDQNATRAVLQTPSGDLVVRDSNIDYNDPERHKLDTEMRNPPAPVVPAGALGAAAP